MLPFSFQNIVSAPHSQNRKLAVESRKKQFPGFLLLSQRGKHKRGWQRCPGFKREDRTGLKPRDNVVTGKCVLGSGGASSGESLESQM